MELRLLSKSAITGTPASIVLVHNEKQIVWNMKSTNQLGKEPAEGTELYDIFAEINAYWRTFQPATLDEVFRIYDRIHDTINRSPDVGAMTQAVRPLVAELFEYHPQEDIDYWVRMKSGLLVPPEIPREYDNSKNWPVERTYLEADYRKLVPLAISMRLMAPIWGEFMYRIDTEMSNNFKEYQAFHLLALSNVYECEAMQRLEVFVTHTIPRDSAIDGAIYAGISREDFPRWMLAFTVVRRLYRGDVRGISNNTHTLITYLWSFINTKAMGLDGHFGKLTSKYTDSGGGNEENNLSRLEGFKIKQDVAAGDVAIVGNYITHSVQIVHDILAGREVLTPKTSLVRRLNEDPGFPQLVAESLASTAALHKESLAQPQVTIAGWVLSDFVPIRSIPYLRNKSDLISMIAFAQAYLWSRGHRELAALVSGVSKNVAITDTTIGDNKTRMTREQLERLSEVYPYLRRSRGKQKQSRSTNQTLSTIDTVTEALSERNWMLTLPTSWVSQLRSGSARDRRYDVPTNIRGLLADLVTDLDQRKRVIVANSPVMQVRPTIEPALVLSAQQPIIGI